MNRNNLKIDIPHDRECCWNCRFAVFGVKKGFMEKCKKKNSRWYLPRTYKCKDFYNKEWPVPKEGESHD